LDNEILKKVNVLYVEDEDEVRNLTVSILSRLVKNVVEAVNGVDGLEKFKQYNGEGSVEAEPFDIVVTDINMPKMDGLKMLESIHDIDHDIPSIITTAHNDSDFLREAINQRVRGYVNKPLNLRDLMDSIIVAVEPKFLKDRLIDANKNLESQVEEKTLELRSIIDSQENMIAVIDDSKITNMNKTMIDFFGVEDIETFIEKHECICSKFLKQDGYFYSDNEENWIDDLSKLDDIKRVVRMVDLNDDHRIFQVSVKTFYYKTNHHVISFTDITELKNYTYELQYQATHDNLTALFNRQKLNDDLNKEILRNERYGHGISLVMFDIDNFKSINDTYGHDVGDVVLKDISKILLGSIRSTDIAARWGGEEFMVLLPETSALNAKQIAEAIRKNVEEHSFEKVPHSITISIGVAEFDKEKDCRDTIIKHVDVALYKAKANGKNQVVKYEK
jgi:diguanylate cyclase (GGDEF)-like protein